jgi:hypothetical protein
MNRWIPKGAYKPYKMNELERAEEERRLKIVNLFTVSLHPEDKNV